MNLLELEEVQDNIFAIKFTNYHEIGVSFQDILDECIESCDAAHRLQLESAFAGLREHNSQLLAGFDADTPIQLLLDWRKSKTENGFLGDAVEASRLVNAVADIRPVHVITPEGSIFGEGRENVQVTTISSDTYEAMTWKSPCRSFSSNSTFHEAVVTSSLPANPLIAVPTICTFPYWWGEQVPPPTLSEELETRYFKPSTYGYLRLFKCFWQIGELSGLNQVHAHLLWLYLLGVCDDPPNIQPPSLRMPDTEREIETVIGGELDAESHLLLIHIGTDGEDHKKWPLHYWCDLIRRVLNELDDVALCLLWPSDCEQYYQSVHLYNCSIGLDEHRTFQFEKSNLSSFIGDLRAVLDYFDVPPTLVGLDSFPAGHLYPSIGGRSVVIGNKKRRDYCFSCPASNDSLLVLPGGNRVSANQIKPDTVFDAICHSLGKPVAN